MELKQLERFLAVVDHGSLADTARRLGLTQQAISASISNLEDEIGVRLFDRQPGGKTRLTSYAKALIPHARSQLAADARAQRMLRGLANAESGTVTIGIGETFAGDVIAEAVTRLHSQRPQLRINLVEGYSEQILQRFYDGEFDFVGAGVSRLALKEGFRAETIYAANDVIACRPDHPLAKKRKLTLADLQGYGWLVPYSRPSDVDTICEYFIAEGLNPPTQFIGSDAYRIGMKLLTRNDLLIMTSPALVNNRFAEKAYAIRVLKIDRPTVRRHASLVLCDNRTLTPAAQLLLDLVREAVKSVSTVEKLARI